MRTERYAAPVACSCLCGCAEDATTTDDAGQDCCDACADYYVNADGQPVCSREQDDRTCRHCGEDIIWGPIQTHGPGAPNDMVGRCACREWASTERGPGNWCLSEGEEVQS